MDREHNDAPVNAGVGGQDFGWFHMEADACFRAKPCEPAFYTGPVLTYPHQDEAGETVGCAVVGGYAYRGSEQPRLDDVYVFGDFCSGTIWGASATEMLDGPAQAYVLATLGSAISSFGEDDAGELYVVDHANGDILRLIAR